MSQHAQPASHTTADAIARCADAGLVPKLIVRLDCGDVLADVALSGEPETIVRIPADVASQMVIL